MDSVVAEEGRRKRKIDHNFPLLSGNDKLTSVLLRQWRSFCEFLTL